MISDISLTSAWTPGKQSGLEIPACRFESPPTLRYTSAAPAPGWNPSFQPAPKSQQLLNELTDSVFYLGVRVSYNNLPASRGLEWCSGQSWAGCCVTWSSVCPKTLCTADPQCETCPSWIWWNWALSSQTSWSWSPDLRLDPLTRRINQERFMTTFNALLYVIALLWWRLTVFPQILNEGTGGVVEQSCYVVIQRVHVLCQPVGGIIVNLESQFLKEISKYLNHRAQNHGVHWFPLSIYLTPHKYTQYFPGSRPLNWLLFAEKLHERN